MWSSKWKTTEFPIEAIQVRHLPSSSTSPSELKVIDSFLTLDPHPCPEIIYWAADSRQLVIAQPDRVSLGVRSRRGRSDDDVACEGGPAEIVQAWQIFIVWSTAQCALFLHSLLRDEVSLMIMLDLRVLSVVPWESVQRCQW